MSVAFNPDDFLKAAAIMAVPPIATAAPSSLVLTSVSHVMSVPVVPFSLKKRTAELELELSEARKDAKRESKLAKREIRQLKKGLDEANEGRSAAEQELATLRQEHHHVRHVSHGRAAELKNLRRERHQEHQIYQAVVADHARLAHENQRAHQAAHGMAANLIMLQQERQQERQILKDVVDDLASADRDIGTLQQQLQSSHENNRRLSQKVDELATSTAALQRRNDQAKSAILTSLSVSIDLYEDHQAALQTLQRIPPDVVQYYSSNGSSSSTS